MTDDNRLEWIAELYVDDHGVSEAVERLQAEYEAAFDDRAQRVLAVLSHIREEHDAKEVSA